MKSTLSKVALFAAGALVGSAVTWKYLSSKYEKIIEDEVADVKRVFFEKMGKDTLVDIHNDGDSDEEEPEEGQTKPAIHEYRAMVDKNEYRSEYDPAEDDDDPEDRKGPYVITPDEFGWLSYDTVSLTYYADGVLTDENDDVVEDVDELIGSDSLTHFGEYEDDSVFVRNDELKCDYEILLDQRNYSDVWSTNPHRAEDE